MVEELKIKEGFQQTEVGIIPEDWKVEQLSEIAHFENGKAHEQFIDEQGDFVVVNSKFISTEGRVRKHSNKNIFPLKKGDITIVMSDIPKGKALAKCFLIDKENKYTLNQRIGGITANEDTDNKYLFYKLNRNKYYLSFDSGTGQTNIKRQEILDCPVVLPPTRTEQTAIATALSDMDSLIEDLEKLLVKKQNIKQGAMQELLTGRKRINGFETNQEFQKTEIGRIPKDWSLISYDKAFNFLTTATYSRADLTLSGEIGYVHYGDIHTKWNHFLDLNKTDLPHINSEQLKSYPTLKDGDLIMADASEDYDGICSSVEVKNLGDRKVISGLHTFLLRDKQVYFVNGFKGYLHNNQLIKSQMDKLATGLKVYGVSKGNLKLIQIPLPSTKLEQSAICNALSSMETEIEQLDTKLSKYKMLKTGMMQELLTGKKRLV